MVFRIAYFRSCSCMKMLRWLFAYSAMAFNNSHLNWSSWFTTQNRLVSGVKDLVLGFLNFLFLCFFFLFLIRCFSSLLELDEAKSREKLELILLLFLSELLSKDRFLSLMSSSIWAIFWKIHIVICIICHLISPQIWEKNIYKGSFKFQSSVLFTCE